MKRERLTQIVLVMVGLLNLATIYFLYTDLRHSSWLLEQKNATEPMFLGFFIPVGIFILVAAWQGLSFASSHGMECECGNPLSLGYSLPISR